MLPVLQKSRDAFDDVRRLPEKEDRMWLIDVELVNSETGDVVRKRLDLSIDSCDFSPDAYATLVAKVFEKSLVQMLEKTRELSAKSA